MKFKGTGIVILVAVALVAFTAAYKVDETEQVVITQFGRIIGEPKKDPGLKFKIPFIQTANYFPKNLLDWDGDPGQIPTLDKTFIWVDTFARWKIVDPVKFFQTVNNLQNATGKLNDIIDPAVRNFITSYALIDAVRKSNRKLDTTEVGLEDKDTAPRSFYTITLGREKIKQGIMEQAQPKLLKRSENQYTAGWLPSAIKSRKNSAPKAKVKPQKFSVKKSAICSRSHRRRIEEPRK